MPPKPETAIQHAVMEYLFYESKHKPLFYWRANNLPVPITNNNRVTGFRPVGVKGVPDLNLIYGGLYIGWEIKTATGKQSEDQKSVQSLIERAGGIYHLIRSVDDAQARLKEIYTSYPLPAPLDDNN